MRLLGTSAVWAEGGMPFAAPYSNGYENPGVFPAAVDLERPAEYGRGHEVLEVSGIGSSLLVDQREVRPWRIFMDHRWSGH
ncbi:hypothetical protein IscW_ISCW000592 [Ixodes scapularis]|uniref:Uncharacterized protein n=1 Tax=Ixodes scapularis TaxID=6945 RepID=B7P4J0_IXOSC|nr:hypothetical protein IscW_ISCW000592 [Ixodes scapularis]|eukprot:XP_002406085.1 hypothetical protein IscW_ISCW000592 [Ixodes scapularis]